jgi:hypothetical protein
LVRDQPKLSFQKMLKIFLGRSTTNEFPSFSEKYIFFWLDYNNRSFLKPSLKALITFFASPNTENRKVTYSKGSLNKPKVLECAIQDLKNFKNYFMESPQYILLYLYKMFITQINFHARYLATTNKHDHMELLEPLRKKFKRIGDKLDDVRFPDFSFDYILSMYSYICYLSFKVI